MAIKQVDKYFLGALLTNPKVYYTKIKEMIDAINSIDTDGLDVASGSQSGSNSPTINQPSGRITTASLTTAALTTGGITLTNSFITSSSKVFVSLNAYAGTGTPLMSIITPGTGSVSIKFYNAHATVALNAAMTIDFLVVN